MASNLKGISDCGTYFVTASPVAGSRDKGAHRVFTQDKKRTKLIHFDLYYSNEGVFSLAPFLLNVQERIESPFPQAFAQTSYSPNS